MKLVALTGLPRSGKDTAAQWFTSRGYVRRAFADPLKEAAAVLLNRPVDQIHGEHNFDREAVLPEWGFSTRWFLQVLGTECLRRQVREDFWVERMRHEIKSCPSHSIVITDCRFENEAALVRDLGGVVIEIVRAGCTSTGHVSDAGVRPDRIVYNNGTIADLHEQIADNMMILHAATTRRPAAE